jgi:hypothetical protein
MTGGGTPCASGPMSCNSGSRQFHEHAKESLDAEDHASVGFCGSSSSRRPPGSPTTLPN